MILLVIVLCKLMALVSVLVYVFSYYSPSLKSIGVFIGVFSHKRVYRTLYLQSGGGNSNVLEFPLTTNYD